MTTKMNKLTTTTTTTITNKKEQAERLKIVVCCDGLIDDSQKVFAFYPCNGPTFKTNQNFSEKNCCSNECVAHICCPVKLRGPPVTKDQKSIFLVFYSDGNFGDEFSFCDESATSSKECPSYHPVCGCYTTREAALTALELPLDSSTLPDRGTDVHSTVEPPLVTTYPCFPTGTDADFGESFINGELYCREYPVTGW
jgi:hypothetical protein